MTRKILGSAVFLFVLTLAMAGCEKQASSPGAGEVKASVAYIEHFGLPPTPDSGLCYARVGFYPLRSDPARVRAVPMFLFRETGQLQLLLDRLASGAIPLLPESDLFNPFPEATLVQVRARDGDAVTLNVSFPKQLNAAPNLSSIAAMLTETAVQFEGTERVIILQDGKPLPEAPVEGYRQDLLRVAPVGAPALFMVNGAWEKGSAVPEEIAANFDRPVKIEDFRLEDASGQEIRGDYFQSLFNMSVVIHPENAVALHEGMTLRAQWNVTDELGRQGQGSGDFQLRRHDHPAIGSDRR